MLSLQSRLCPRDYYDEDSSGADENISAKPELNATEIELHYIEDYAVPYIGKNPGHLYEYTFKVKNYSASSVQWSIEGDKQAKIQYRINDSGEIYMFMGNDIDEVFSECTVVATLSNGSRLKAKVRGYDDGTTYIREKLGDFKASYITPEMTEYDKMDAVARYVSHEYDYEAYQPEMYRYFITGSGDCMASRVAVEYLCNELGFRAIACRSLDSHGQTIVKADGKVYLVTTGFGGKGCLISRFWGYLYEMTI